MENHINIEPQPKTVIVDSGGRWTRTEYANRVEFFRFDTRGYQERQIAWASPDAELVVIDGQVMVDSGGYYFTLMFQGVLSSSRMVFKNGKVVWFGGFRRREFLTLRDDGSSTVVGIPPWAAPHDLEFEIAGNIALTHIVVSLGGAYQVQAWLFSIEKGFYQVDEMVSVESQPGSASIAEGADGKIVLTLHEKTITVS